MRVGGNSQEGELSSVVVLLLPLPAFANFGLSFFLALRLRDVRRRRTAC